MFTFSKLSNLMAALAVICVMSITSTSSFAEEAKAEKRKDVTYMAMTLVRYKAGMRRKALTMIDEHFSPASKKAGAQMPWAMHMQSGKWDAVFFWDFKNGMSDMEWATSPNNIKWRNALAKQEGGMDKAMTLLKEYSSMIAMTDSMIGHHHDEPKE